MAMPDPMFRRSALAQLASADRLDETIEVTNARAWMALAAVGTLIAAAVVWGVVARIPTIVRAEGYLIHAGGVQTVEAPAGGRVQAMLVQAGEWIGPDRPVARIVRADGQVDAVTPDAAGRVLDLRAAVGNEVERGTVLLSYERPDEPLEARLYLPQEAARRVRPGMTVHLALVPPRPDEAGVLLGEVAEIGSFPATQAGIQRVLGSDDLARKLFANGPPVEARVVLQAGSEAGQYRWRGDQTDAGSTTTLQGGTPLMAEIIAAEQPPIAVVLGQSGR